MVLSPTLIVNRSELLNNQVVQLIIGEQIGDHTMQSRKASLLEASANTLVGYLVAVLSQLLIAPVFDIIISLHDNLIIALYFTAISMLRSYAIRRFFNRRKKKLAIESRIA